MKATWKQLSNAIKQYDLVRLSRFFASGEDNKRGTKK